MKRLVLSLMVLAVGCAVLFWKFSASEKTTHETIQTKAAVDLKRLLKAKAIPQRPVGSDLSKTNAAAADEKSDKKPVKLTPEQIAAYLQKYKRSAGSLITAFEECRDPALLKEAAEKYPNDPHVQYAVLMQDELEKSLSDEERTAWLERLAKSSPGNGVANVFLALNDLKTGQSGQALAQLKAANEKQGLSGFYSERLQDCEEMLLSAGLSPAEAKEQALEQLRLPLEAKMKSIAVQLAELEKNYLTAGNQASASEIASVVETLGRRWGDPQTGNSLLISELVGMAMQRVVLNNLDPNTYYDFLGKTAGERLEELKQRRAEIKVQTTEFANIFPQLTERDKMIYLDRLKMFGEPNATTWLRQTHGSDQTTQGQ